MPFTGISHANQANLPQLCQPTNEEGSSSLGGSGRGDP